MVSLKKNIEQRRVSLVKNEAYYSKKAATHALKLMSEQIRIHAENLKVRRYKGSMYCVTADLVCPRDEDMRHYATFVKNVGSIVERYNPYVATEVWADHTRFYVLFVPQPNIRKAVA